MKPFHCVMRIAWKYSHGKYCEMILLFRLECCSRQIFKHVCKSAKSCRLNWKCSAKNVWRIQFQWKDVSAHKIGDKCVWFQCVSRAYWPGMNGKCWRKTVDKTLRIPSSIYDSHMQRVRALYTFVLNSRNSDSVDVNTAKPHVHTRSPLLLTVRKKCIFSFFFFCSCRLSISRNVKSVNEKES